MFIGCAGWSLGRDYWPQFPAEGTHLQRYAARFDCVEINSSFYRPHRRQTYARWADSVPPGFRFSVKVPKQITHELRLQNCEQALDEFLGQCEGLADRLGCLLVQLPPSLAFEPASAEAFFVALRQRFAGDVVLEPRHESWVVAASILQVYRIAQVVSIRRGSVPTVRRRAGRVCAIGDCMAHHGFITVLTSCLICSSWRRTCGSALLKAPASGAFSTTPPVAPRWATR